MILESAVGQAPPGRLETTAVPGDILRAAAEALPLPLLVTEAAQDRVVYANPAFLRAWATTAPCAITDLVRQMRGVTADPTLIPHLWIERCKVPLPPEGLESHLLLQDGRELLWKSNNLYQADGTPAGELHLFEELPAPVVVSPVTLEVDDLFRLSFEKAAVGMTLVSSDYRFLRANTSFCRMLGYEERELLEANVFELAGVNATAGVTDWLTGLGEGRETFHLDRRFRHAAGNWVWVHLSVSVVRDAEGRPVYFIAMAEDVTQRKLEEQERDRRTRELLTLATTDALTGLYNHRSMQELLAHRMMEAAHRDQHLSILMLDVDYFRALNEKFGHDAGDRALRCVAECMRSTLRGQDLACRYGGEEFVLILSGVSLLAAQTVAERVRLRIEEALPIAPHDVRITCSIGVASFPAHASTAASLLKAADVALYHAKRAGRNQVSSYEPGCFDYSPNQYAPLELDQLTSRMEGASPEAVNALVTAIDLRDRYTGAHCQRVGALAMSLARKLGLSEPELEVLRLGAPLLDVGKIGLPDDVLTKPGRLTRAEWSLMRQHPVWGEQLVRRSALPPEVLQLVRWHHERLDGSGYPDGVSGSQIPLLVRIVNVADVAIALQDDRPHRDAWPKERVFRYLRRQADKRLDAEVLRAYFALGDEL